jgi:hypothetical protein
LVSVLSETVSVKLIVPSAIAVAKSPLYDIPFASIYIN